MSGDASLPVVQVRAPPNLRRPAIDLHEPWGPLQQTQLHIAAKNNNGQVLELLIWLGADPNARDSEGRTPLHCACDGRNHPDHPCLLLVSDIERYPPRHLLAEIVRVLLDAGANPNSKDRCGQTPFHYASWYGTVEIVNLMLARGADMGVLDNMGRTTLHHAVPNENAAVVRFLVARGAGAYLNVPNRSGRTPLHLACYCGNLDVVEFLLPFICVDLQAKDNHGETPLHGACGSGNRRTRLNIVQVLVGRGANIYAQDNDGETPLDKMAPVTLDTDVINFLLQRCRETVIEQYGDLCLHFLLRSVAYVDDEDDVAPAEMLAKLPIGSITMDEWLLFLQELMIQSPECIRAQHGGTGELALHVACRLACPVQVVRFLAEQNEGGIRSRDNNGATPLHAACRSPHAVVEVLRHLVEHFRAALFLADLTGSLPLHTACMAAGGPSSLERIQYLVQEGDGTLDARDGNGRMPLHLACRCPDTLIEVLRVLVYWNPAAVLLSDATGSLPLHWACTAAGGERSLEKITLLVDEGGPETLRALNNNGALPLHVLCASNPDVTVVEYVMGQHADALLETTTRGDLPIEVACEHHASVPVVYALMRLKPADLIEEMKRE